MAGSTLSKIGAAVRGQCPRCGSRTLFVRLAALNPMCSRCGLDFTRFAINARLDAVFGLLIAVLVGVLAVLIDREYRPPLLLHLLWFPITLGAVAGAMRLQKGLVVGLSYRDEAPN